MWRVGDIEFVTEAWVVFRHECPERPLVEATSQPNSLPPEVSPTGCHRQWIHTTFAGALSCLL
eukprot:7096371-Prorocentrum_lima.AAC.1